MNKFMLKRLPESFTNNYPPLAPPNRTKSLLIDKVKKNSKFLQQFPAYFCPEFGIPTPLKINTLSRTQFLKRHFMNHLF